MKKLFLKINHPVIPLLLLLLFFAAWAFLPSSALAAVINPASEVLKSDNDIKNNWNRVMQAVDSVVVVVLIIVAFAEILRLNINTYGVKKILPALIFAVVASHFSYLLCRWLIDLANVAVELFIDKPGTNQLTDPFKNIAFPAIDANGGGLFQAVLQLIFLFVGSGMILILAFLLFIRNWLIYFLVPLGPLAFMAAVVPQGKSIFNQWWSNYIKWTFMPVVSMFWLWIGSLWIGNLTSNEGTMAFVFAIVTFYLAMTTPFKMGGAVMSQWGNLGKKAWRSTAGNAWKYTGGSAIKNYSELYREKLGSWYNQQGEKGGWYNPVAYFSRSGATMRKRIEQAKKDRGNTQNDLEGTVLSRNQTLRREINAGRSLGGTWEEEEKKLMREYQESEQGQAWMGGRERYKARLKALDSEIGRYDKEAALGVRRDAGQAELFDRILTANTAGTIAEKDYAALDNELAARFFEIKKKKINVTDNDGNVVDQIEVEDEGQANYAMKKEYFAVMARNKEFEDVVGKLQKDGLTAVIRDQVHIDNMKKQMEDLDREVEVEEKMLARLTELDNKADRNDTENRELAELQKVSREDRAANIAALRTALPEKQNEIIRQAQAYAADKDYLQGMADVVVDERTGKRTLASFAGLVNGNKTIGGLMANRAGKHMNIETNDEMKKYTDDQRTVSEIRQELESGVGKIGGREVVDRWLRGDKHLNTAEQNFEIEARMGYIASKAQRSNDIQSTDAIQAMVQLATPENTVGTVNTLNSNILRTSKPRDWAKLLVLPKGSEEEMKADRMAIQDALRTYKEEIENNNFTNVRAAAQAILEQRTVSTADADYYKQELVTKTSDRQQHRLVFSAAARQPMSGVDDVASAHLYGSVDAEEIAQAAARNAAEAAVKAVQRPGVVPQAAAGSVPSYVQIMHAGSSGGDAQMKELVRALRENTVATKDELIANEGLRRQLAAQEALEKAGVKADQQNMDRLSEIFSRHATANDPTSLVHESDAFLRQAGGRADFSLGSLLTKPSGQNEPGNSTPAS